MSSFLDGEDGLNKLNLNLLNFNNVIWVKEIGLFKL